MNQEPKKPASSFLQDFESAAEHRKIIFRASAAYASALFALLDRHLSRLPEGKKSTEKLIEDLVDVMSDRIQINTILFDEKLLKVGLLNDTSMGNTILQQGINKAIEALAKHHEAHGYHQDEQPSYQTYEQALA